MHVPQIVHCRAGDQIAICDRQSIENLSKLCRSKKLESQVARASITRFAQKRSYAHHNHLHFARNAAQSRVGTRRLGRFRKRRPVFSEYYCISAEYQQLNHARIFRKFAQSAENASRSRSKDDILCQPRAPAFTGTVLPVSGRNVFEKSAYRIAHCCDCHCIRVFNRTCSRLAAPSS